MLIKDIVRKGRPDELDSVEFQVNDIKFHVYGVLHGVTGGSNKEYVEAVNRTIRNSSGVRYCEKSMKSLYKDLDIDMNDWLVFKPSEAFKFSFCSLINPRFWWNLVRTTVSERFSKPRFGRDGVYSLSDIASSLYFHNVKPLERREICGFPSPDDYLKLNLLRREGKSKKKMRFQDPDWAWLEMIEPNACIPLRSIHMFEYVFYHATKNGIKEVSIFCGEIHNSDIEWYVSTLIDDDHWVKEHSKEIKNSVFNNIENRIYFRFRKILYFLSLSLGASCAMLPYAFLINYILNNIHMLI